MGDGKCVADISNFRVSTQKFQKPRNTYHKKAKAATVAMCDFQLLQLCGKVSFLLLHSNDSTLSL